MLAFICSAESSLSHIRRDGLRIPSGKEPAVFRSLEAAGRACTDGVTVVDLLAESERLGVDPADLELSFVPPASIVATVPLRSVRAIVAAGAFVTRRTPSGLELLLIYRRGAWDLPKGKLDRDESIAAAARREVCEELGIDRLDLHESLGVTVHGYQDGSRFVVKTTHWFLASTPARTFHPETREGIERVQWIPWSDARARLGFPSLRYHAASLEEIVAGLTSHWSDDL